MAELFLPKLSTMLHQNTPEPSWADRAKRIDHVYTPFSRAVLGSGGGVKSSSCQVHPLKDQAPRQRMPQPRNFCHRDFCPLHGHLKIHMCLSSWPASHITANSTGELLRRTPPAGGVGGGWHLPVCVMDRYKFT